MASLQSPKDDCYHWERLPNRRHIGIQIEPAEEQAREMVIAFGIASIPEHCHELKNLLALATMAMKRAKHAGGIVIAHDASDCCRCASVGSRREALQHFLVFPLMLTRAI
ncbi:MAG TPA: hypothetical protein V6D17_17090 [Candidatus Obscuribacterales bacterium]